MIAPFTFLFSIIITLLKFTFTGPVLNILVIFDIILRYPTHFLIATLSVFFIYKFFIFLGFNQKRSIKLSSPYLNGKYYLHQLSKNIPDPHNFYHLEPGLFSRPMYCFVCDANVNGWNNEGLCCDICGYTVHQKCVAKQADLGHCKNISTFGSLQEALHYCQQTLTSPTSPHFAGPGNVKTIPTAYLNHLQPDQHPVPSTVSSQLASQQAQSDLAQIQLNPLFTSSSTAPPLSPSSKLQLSTTPLFSRQTSISKTITSPMPTTARHKQHPHSTSTSNFPSTSSTTASISASLTNQDNSQGKPPQARQLSRSPAPNDSDLDEISRHSSKPRRNTSRNSKTASRTVKPTRNVKNVQSSLNGSDSADSDDNDDVSSTPVRTNPRRSSRTRKSTIIAESVQDDDSDQSNHSTKTSQTSKSTKKSAQSTRGAKKQHKIEENEDSEESDGETVVKPTALRPSSRTRKATNTTLQSSQDQTDKAPSNDINKTSNNTDPLPNLPPPSPSSLTYFPSTSPTDFPLTHHWVFGNHSSISDICFLCGDPVGSVFYRLGMHCLWCGLHVHERCLSDRRPSSLLQPHCDNDRWESDRSDDSSSDDEQRYTTRCRSRRSTATSLPLDHKSSTSSTSSTITNPSPPHSHSSLHHHHHHVHNHPHLQQQHDPYVCNLGALAKAIIPPHCIYPGPGFTAASARYDIATKYTHEAISREKLARGEVVLNPSSFNTSPKLDFPQLFQFCLPSWSYPLLVIINRKSGGNGGVEKMHDFVECLNPLQVWDLSTHPAELPLVLFKQSGFPFRVLVCGGDGTFSSVLHSIDHVFGIVPHVNEQDLSQALFNTNLSSLPPNSTLLTINPSTSSSSSPSTPIHVPPPPVATLPLGTGNDLAQVLGWGGKNPSADPRQLLYDVMNGRLAVLDRWDVNVEDHNLKSKKDLGTPPNPPCQWIIADYLCKLVNPLAEWLKPILPVFMPTPNAIVSDHKGIMNNYIGFGLDAVIAHQFAALRATYPHLFISQAGNKAIYGRVGLGQWLYPYIRNGLNAAPFTTKFSVDGVELTNVDHLQGVCCLGIKSFGGGICFWGDRAGDENTSETDPTSGGKFRPPALDDGMFELIGFESSAHMLMIQTGQALPHRLAQGRKLEVEILGKLPVQIDGEQWGLRENCKITVQLRTQSLMIVPLHSGPTQLQTDNLGHSPLTQEVNVTNMLHDVMQTGIQSGIISSQQSSQLMIGFTKRFIKVNPSSHFYRPSHDLD